jgi:drug/metabolite transporter (DMT)-like permease
MPIVAVMLGILDNEHLAWHDYLGLGLILTGVLLINTKFKKTADQEQ